ncbi:MAG: antitoxin VapB family protein [Haloarculaceae archaeon]
MGTRTVRLDEDAYEKLEAEKLPGESFSDVVRRLTSDFILAKYYGVLDEDTATELDDIINSDP